MSKVTITQKRSANGADARQRDTLRSLGLRRINHTVEHEDTPQLRGMVHAVRHLVEAAGEAGRSSAAGGPQGDS